MGCNFESLLAQCQFWNRFETSESHLTQSSFERLAWRFPSIDPLLKSRSRKDPGVWTLQGDLEFPLKRSGTSPLPSRLTNTPPRRQKVEGHKPPTLVGFVTSPAMVASPRIGLIASDLNASRKSIQLFVEMCWNSRVTDSVKGSCSRINPNEIGS